MIDAFWTHTNFRENHLRRNGRIYGKIKLLFPEFDTWQCIYRGVVIGERKTNAGARRLVEKEYLRHGEEK